MKNCTVIYQNSLALLLTKGDDTVKKYLSFILILFLTISGSVYANSLYQSITAEKAWFNLYINGEKVRKNINWLLVNNKAYLPVREVENLFNFSVDWDKSNDLGNSVNSIKIKTEENIPPQYNYRLSKETAEKLADIIFEEAYSEEFINETKLVEGEETDTEYVFCRVMKIPTCGGGATIVISKQDGRIIDIGGEE